MMALVADGLGRDVLVGPGILLDRRDVQAALVGEGALADVGRAAELGARFSRSSSKRETCVSRARSSLVSPVS